MSKGLPPKKYLEHVSDQLEKVCDESETNYVIMKVVDAMRLAANLRRIAEDL